MIKKENGKWIVVGNEKNCVDSHEDGDMVEIVYLNGYKKMFPKPKTKAAQKPPRVQQPLSKVASGK